MADKFSVGPVYRSKQRLVEGLYTEAHNSLSSLVRTSVDLVLMIHRSIVLSALSTQSTLRLGCWSACRCGDRCNPQRIGSCSLARR